jgi:hypothetical protein
MTNQRGRHTLPDLDLDLIVAFEADIGRAKVFNNAPGEFEWHVVPKQCAIEQRERLQEWRERADGGRR